MNEQKAHRRQILIASAAAVIILLLIVVFFPHHMVKHGAEIGEVSVRYEGEPVALNEETQSELRQAALLLTAARSFQDGSYSLDGVFEIRCEIEGSKPLQIVMGEEEFCYYESGFLKVYRITHAEKLQKCLDGIRQDLADAANDSDGQEDPEQQTHHTDHGLTADEQKLLAEAEDWVQANYGEVYEVRNLDGVLWEILAVDGTAGYRFNVTCETKYKYQSIEELPFIQGMHAEIQGKELTAAQQEAIDAYIGDIAGDANFGDYNELSVDIVVCVDEKNPQAPHKLYYYDLMNETVASLDLIKIDTKQLYENGRTAAREILETA